jgi:hypothetical protein
MSNDSQSPTQSAGEIQFDRADFVQPSAGGPQCGVCGTPLHGHYFEINEKMTCESCRYQVEAAFSQKAGAGGFFKAAFAGLGAAVAGSLVYYAVRESTGYEFGLIAILVGFAVGHAVRWGSRGKGGWLYQSLAILLTYLAIVSTYVPVIFQEFDEHAEKGKSTVAAPAQAGAPAPAESSSPMAQTAVPDAPKQEPEPDLTFADGALALGALILFIMAIPFLAGFENLIGLAIIAFGLYEAWKLNRRTALSISGPFSIGRAPATSPAGP